VAVTQRSSARYRHRPFRCCSSPKTKSDHQQEIRRKYGLRDFADAEAELAEWVAARAWTSGDGPKAIFLDVAGSRFAYGQAGTLLDMVPAIGEPI